MKLLRVFMVDGWRSRRLQSVDLCLFKLFSTKKLLKKGGERKGRWNRTKVTAIYRNICLRLQVVRRHLHSHSHSHRHNLTQLSVRLHDVTPPSHPSRSIVPASPSIHVNHLGRLSERVELSSQLSRCSAHGTRLSAMKSTTLVQTFNNLRFGHGLVRPGSHTSKSKAEENFLTKCQVSCW